MPPSDVIATPSEDAPVAVGVKETVAVIDCPAASVVPAAGRPVTAKGAAGSVNVVNVSVCAPWLVRVNVELIGCPAVVEPRFSDVVLATSDACAASPLPDMLNVCVPTDVAAASVAV